MLSSYQLQLTGHDQVMPLFVYNGGCAGVERLSKVEEYVPGLIIFITPNSMNILCCTYNEYYYVTSFPSLPSGLISWGGGWGGGGGGRA